MNPGGGGGGGGLALAEKIREADEDAVLVFLTNYERFALDGFRVEARNYFLKTDWKEGLGRWLPKFYRKWKEGREEVYWHDYNGEQCAISIRDILVLEYDTGEQIKNTDVVGIQVAGHAFGMAPSGDISLEDHAVITGDRTINLVSIFIRE